MKKDNSPPSKLDIVLGVGTIVITIIVLMIALIILLIIVENEFIHPDYMGKDAFCKDNSYDGYAFIQDRGYGCYRQEGSKIVAYAVVGEVNGSRVIIDTGGRE